MARSTGKGCSFFLSHILADFQQICNFLKHMATEINLDAITPKANVNQTQAQFKTDFNPIRRKLQILSD
jgi:hypothetical protein